MSTFQEYGDGVGGARAEKMLGSATADLKINHKSGGSKDQKFSDTRDHLDKPGASTAVKEIMEETEPVLEFCTINVELSEGSDPEEKRLARQFAVKKARCEINKVDPESEEADALTEPPEEEIKEELIDKHYEAPDSGTDWIHVKVKVTYDPDVGYELGARESDRISQGETPYQYAERRLNQAAREGWVAWFKKACSENSKYFVTGEESSSFRDDA